ncbi:hypothetical protein [Saccharopolyspora shandongensis]|uniref:hypothetical protein n=1 Tax=Saccharopolyspora shandongensis TaxID=418495 RepID=UPI001FEC8D6A|nr:hypothetical protein [Saccharopolyspora shandongensis]
MASEQGRAGDAGGGAPRGAPAPAIAAKGIAGIDELSRDFTAAARLFFLATTAADGSVDLSPRGDAAGSVLLFDDDHGEVAEALLRVLGHGESRVSRSASASWGTMALTVERSPPTSAATRAALSGMGASTTVFSRHPASPGRAPYQDSWRRKVSLLPHSQDSSANGPVPTGRCQKFSTSRWIAVGEAMPNCTGEVIPLLGPATDTPA